jgi:hypothetical protein
MMSNKKFLFVFLFLMGLSQIQAQVIKAESYKWTTTPEKIDVDKQFADASAVVLEDIRIYNYYYEKVKEKDNLFLEETHHKVIQINDTRAIEAYNRLYIPLSGVIEIVEIQARTIAPGGKITDLDKDKIKELSNKEGEGAYKIFAFEGLEKGSRLEYFYKVKEEADFTLRNTVQGTDPVQLHQLEIITPENLKFEYKTYNGKSEVIDTVIDEKRYSLLTSRNVPGLEEEKYSTYTANLMREEAQLAYNSVTGSSRILSYNTAVQRTYPVLFDIDAKAEKKIEKISEQLGLSKMDTKEKVKHIENYIKTTIQMEKTRTADLEDISKILQNKLADNNGILKLFINFFVANGVSCQVVYTTDRNKVIFDPDFESWNYLAETLFYFPDLGQYIDPTDITYRYPLIPATYTLNSGLFMEEVAVGKFKSATYSIRKIPAQDPSTNGETITADCHFTTNMDSIDVKFTRSFLGQMAAPYRLVFNYVQKDEKKKALEETMKFSMSDARVVSAHIENTDFLESEKPLVTTGEVIGSSLIEKTGKDVIFMIGDLIGPQTELYQEKERKTPIDVFIAHNLNRTIKLQIPAGYKLSGQDAIKMNIHFDFGGKDSYGFISDYTLADNVLTISIREYYYAVQLPKSEFENFRKVINASADFNKVNIVLEKL